MFRERTKMAGVEKHDENFPHENVTTSDDNIVVSVHETSHEGVCTIVPSGNSNEILLYVGDGTTQGVQDLIRVALNQPLSSTTNELQQQLQDAGAKITLQNIGDAHALISMPDGIPAGTVNLIQTEGDLSQQQHVGVVTDEGGDKPDEMNHLFQLATLTDTLVTEHEKSPSDIGVSIEMKSEGLKGDDDSGSALTIGDFIIANVDSTDTEEVIPGELNVGDAFYCLEDIEEALRLYEEKHGVKLYKRDVRSLEALLKRSLKLQKLEKINERLKYGQLLYCCVYGGKRKAQKMACMDESGFARYTDCKMFIRFAISDDGMKLVVNGKLETHNHDEVVTNEQEVEPQYFTNTGNASEIRLGAGFVDLEELYKAVHKYETDNHVHLWRRDGRTVEALAKRAPGTARKIMETNPGLRFAELRFCCSYGGRQSSDDKKDRKATK